MIWKCVLTLCKSENFSQTTFPPDPKNLLSHKYIQKLETISDLRFSAPLGARTLDPNIKSVVLYQLS